MADDVERLKGQHRYRSLNEAAGIDFTSNDYLGLSHHPALRQAIADAAFETDVIGAGGSRLLRGHHRAHAELEAFASSFFRAGKALFFATGFQANFALFTTLPHRHDAIVFDERIHASAKDGIHASLASRYKARHNDPDAFADAARRARAGGARQIWFAVESVYSMDGDVAPLADLAGLVRDMDAMLIVDEAHASAVYGATGRGLTEGFDHDRLITLHTCGKAIGVAGGLVCGPVAVIDYLVNTSRPFIYSTAPPPLIAIAVKRALRLVDEEPWRRQRLHERAALARRLFAERLQAGVSETGTQIVPVILGEDRRAVMTAAKLQEAGFDVRAIRPPTVPAGTSRLRVSISADRTEDEIGRLADTLAGILEDVH